MIQRAVARGHTLVGYIGIVRQFDVGQRKVMVFPGRKYCWREMPHISSPTGCSIKYQLWYWGGFQKTFRNISNGNVFTYLGLMSNVLPWPLTHLSTCVGFCVPTSILGVDSINIFCKISNDKVLAHLGFKSKVMPASLTHLSPRVESAPQSHSMVSTVNFDIGRRAHLISPVKFPTAEFLSNWGLSQGYCQGGTVHLKYTARASNINFDIGRGCSINIPCKIPNGKVLVHLGLGQRYCLDP